MIIPKNSLKPTCLRQLPSGVEATNDPDLSHIPNQGRFNHPAWLWLDAIAGVILLSFTVYILTVIGNGFS